MESETGRLIKTIKKEKEWLVFGLPNGQTFRFAVKDNERDKRYSGILIECPKNIKISSETYEPNGNK